MPFAIISGCTCAPLNQVTLSDKPGRLAIFHPRASLPEVVVIVEGVAPRRIRPWLLTTLSEPIDQWARISTLSEPPLSLCSHSSRWAN